MWRGWLTLTGRRLPPGWILIPVSALMMLGVYLNHKTFFGREAGVTMLVLLLTCKLLEMHANGICLSCCFSDFFIADQLFYQQTIAAAFMTLVSVSLLLTAQLSFHYTGLFPSLKQRLKLGFSMMALAIPLTLCAFFLFPRIQGRSGVCRVMRTADAQAYRKRCHRAVSVIWSCQKRLRSG
jgi:hypothetical protein